MPPRARKRKVSDIDTSDGPGVGGGSDARDALLTVSSVAGTPNSSSSVDSSLASLSSSFLTHSSVMQTHQQHSSRTGVNGNSNSGSSNTRALSKRSQLSAREKLAVVEWYYAHGKNQQATSAHFKALPGYEKLSQSSVSRYITGEAKIRELVESGRANVVRVNSVRNPDFENVLVAWLDRMGGADCSRLSGDLIKQTAAKVYDHLQTPETQRLELSNGWLRAFQFRHGLKGGKPRRSLGGSGDPMAAAASLAGPTGGVSELLDAPSESPPPLASPSAVTPVSLTQTVRYTESLPAAHSGNASTGTTAAAAVGTPLTSAAPSPQPPSRRTTPSPQRSIATAMAPPTASASAATTGISGIPGMSGTRRPAPLASVPDQVIKREQERVALSIRDFLSWDHRRSLRDVWTFDELPLSYALLPWDAAASGTTGSDVRRQQSFTLALATNADGSERSEPLIIGRTERPRSFKHNRTGSALGFQYLYNRGAWMTADIFSAWLETWNKQLRAQQRHVLLLVDSYSGHKLGKQGFDNIQLEYFGARVTELVQPFCDAVGGIARAFKACYRRLVVLRTADALLSARDFADRERAFKLDQLAAMDLVVRAWPLVANDTIARCWRHARILPMDQVSSRTDVRPSTFTLPELQALQSAIYFLHGEARVKGLALEPIDAAAFVDVDAVRDDATRLEDLVQFAVGARDGASAESSAGAVAGLLNSVDARRGISDSGDMNGSSAGSGGDAAAAANGGGSGGAVDDSDCGSADLNPVHVYRSLLALEQFWREQPLHLSDDVRKLLQLTRTELQNEILRARGQQASPQQQQHQQQQHHQQSTMARGRRK